MKKKFAMWHVNRLQTVKKVYKEEEKVCCVTCHPFTNGKLKHLN